VRRSQPPEYIVYAEAVGAPIEYAWNADIALELYAEKDQNIPLYRRIDDASACAKMSLGVAVAEWIVWRFRGHVDLTDALHRIEAAWAGAADPAWVRTLDCRMTHDDDLFPIEGALELGLTVLGQTFNRYANADRRIYVAEPVVKLATVAAHLVPIRELFDQWLDDVSTRIVNAFPRADPERGKPVPRSFFDRETYGTDTDVDAFLAPDENPYLRAV
jgi:hypothetical protein